jgi:hypothetical protein
MLQLANQIEQLDRYYSVEDKAEVVAFIEQNPALLNLLLETPDQIKRFFPDAPLVLKIVRDYDDPQILELWIYIQTKDDNAVEKYEKVLENWWVDAYYNANVFNLAIGLA